MTCQVTKQIELSVRSPNGTVACQALTKAGCTVLACCCYWDPTGGVVLVVTDDPAQAGRALTTAGYRYEAHPVIVVGPKNQPGLTASVLPDLAAQGIRILCSYASWSDPQGGYLVLKTTDNDRALRVLQASRFIRATADTPNVKPFEQGRQRTESAAEQLIERCS